MITKGIDFIVPVVLLPFLVNKLGISAFGLLSFALAIGIYFSSMMQYGYNISAVRAIARVKDDFSALSTSFSALFISSICICLFFAICYLFLFFIDEIYTEFSLYLSVLFFILMQSIFPAWLFQGIEKMHFIAISNSFCKFLYLIMVLFWVNTPEDSYLVPLLQGFSWMIAIVIAIIIIIKNKLVTFIFPSWRAVKDTYIEGWSAFVTQFAPTLYANSMTFILGVFHGNVIVGIYSAAIRVIEIFNALAFLLVNAALPLLARNMKLHKWVEKVMIFAGGALGLFVFIGSNWFVPVFFTENTEQIMLLVKLSSLMIPFVFIRMAYGPAYLMLIGADKIYQNIVLGSALIGFMLAWIFVPIWSLEAAVIIMVSTSIVMALLTVIVVKHKGYSVDLLKENT